MDLLILAGVLFFLLFRLWDMLGVRHEDEPPPHGIAKYRMHEEALQEQQQSADVQPKNTPALVVEDARKPSDAEQAIYDAKPVFNKIREQDPNFSVEEFTQGARYAFISILEAFSSPSKDLKAVRSLLTPDVRGKLQEAIRARESKNQRQETHVISVDGCTVMEASLERGKIYITVEFISTQINTLYDALGKVIEGNPEKQHKANDRWTFVRAIKAPDPNWELAKIHAP